MSELTSLSAVEMAKLVRTKRVSPAELVEAHLRHIEKVNPALNAFACLDRGAAREQARAAEAAVIRGDRARILLGVPLTIKSSIDVAGLRCECGTRLRQGRTAASDATVVARLKAAGAVILGTTNVPELLMAYETDNFLYGRTNNPWDSERTPGGSSGGEAAAIAAGCSAGGMGSDGGGSIRVPAHFCGICGLKPTPGRIPTTGHFPACAGPSALTGVVGPLARHVSDLQLLFEAAAGHDGSDPSSAPAPVRPVQPVELMKLRVGFYEEDGKTPVSEETRAAVWTAAGALRQQGFVVEAFRPAGIEEARRVWWTLFGEAGAVLMESMFAGRRQDLHPLTLEFFNPKQARKGGFEKLLLAWVDRDLMRTRLFQQMADWQVLLCPVGSVPAFRHGERSWSIDNATVRYTEAFSYSAVFNMLGNPVVVVPVGRSPGGLPIGVQVVGRPWQDEVVLAVAARLEEALGSRTAPAMAAA